MNVKISKPSLLHKVSFQRSPQSELFIANNPLQKNVKVVQNPDVNTHFSTLVFFALKKNSFLQVYFGSKNKIPQIFFFLTRKEKILVKAAAAMMLTRCCLYWHARRMLKRATPKVGIVKGFYLNGFGVVCALSMQISKEILIAVLKHTKGKIIKRKALPGAGFSHFYFHFHPSRVIFYTCELLPP